MVGTEFHLRDGRLLAADRTAHGVIIYCVDSGGAKSAPTEEEWQSARPHILNFLDAVFLPAPAPSGWSEIPADPDALSVQGQEQESGEPDIQV